MSFIDKKYNEKGAYYEFIYQYEIDKKVYYINSLAYEDYYVVVRISSKSKTQVNELVETLDVMISDKVFSNNIASNKKEKACLSCNFPDSW